VQSRSRKPWVGVLIVMLAVLLAVLGYLAVGSGRQYVADRAFRPIVVPAPTAPSGRAADALAAATSTPQSQTATAQPPEPTPAGVAGALAAGLGNPALGPSLAAAVVDASSASVLWQQRTDAAVAPASTSKLLTAAAILSLHKATDQFTTSVVAGSQPGLVVLVGGGDPTLSAAASGRPTVYQQAARVSDLAATVRRSLGGARVQQVVVDDSLFTGPLTAPGWGPDDAPSDYASPITAVMVDGGRDVPSAVRRSAEPDLAAGRALAAALGAADVVRGTAPAGARVLGTVRSAPLSRLVEQMLSESDNVIAEVLARRVAITSHRPASFAGGAAAIGATLAPLGIGVGNGMKDGSGLSVLDRLPSAALSQVLVKSVDPAHPELHPIIGGLSVAGWSGTLVEQDRFTGTARIGQGTVRAKTGSLTGVSALSGVVTDADGRLLVFSFVADKVPSADPVPSRTGIDNLVAALAGCGCR
jgi:D-alanyl-D-alanine carboxypeptidase/D-alanyl-D-alanine-endopeptidase (penicillin-binding protein 4)